MAKHAVLLLATGFEEIEATSVVDVLRRAGVEVTIAGLQAGAIQGAHGIKVLPDTTLGEIEPKKFDAVILPGGNPGYVNLGRDKRVLDAVKTAFELGKIVAAICAAPSVLAQAGILKGKRATIFPGMESALTGAKPLSERVVMDGNLVTSQGPGTALEFALTLVELLVGKQKAQEVKTGLVAKF
ncbi:MAG: DJ-1/PfpI family protein [Methanophagales archaeon ANME-1-THS]|nr:MAG: DJ-1/PfpI family protein [Methanophagales archaeon ANME-1-THS]